MYIHLIIIDSICVLIIYTMYSNQKQLETVDHTYFKHFIYSTENSYFRLIFDCGANVRRIYFFYLIVTFIVTHLFPFVCAIYTFFY